MYSVVYVFQLMMYMQFLFRENQA